ncbi:MAG: cytidine deaminase [Euryarchaeota archaeon]|nr:cytidine deaminase [Euryarchaeota archaeon]
MEKYHGAKITDFTGPPKEEEEQEVQVEIKDTRPPWDIYFARIVDGIAARSTCTRRQIGAIVVNKDHHIVSTGFNGVVRKAPHCSEVGCVKDEKDIASGTGHSICPAVHAEQNALIQAGRAAAGCTLYLNAFPCKICARLIVNAGIERVVISGDYTDKEGLEILKAANIEVTRVSM